MFDPIFELIIGQVDNGLKLPKRLNLSYNNVPLYISPNAPLPTFLIIL